MLLAGDKLVVGVFVKNRIALASILLADIQTYG